MILRVGLVGVSDHINFFSPEHFSGHLSYQNEVYIIFTVDFLNKHINIITNKDTRSYSIFE